MFIDDFRTSSDPTITAISLIGALENPVFPLDIEKIALAIGIQKIKEISSNQFEGMLVALPDKTAGFINVNRNIRETTRRRFTIAHELGHFLITTHQSKYNCNSYDLSNYYDKTNIQEIEANQFAAELLMPEKYFYIEIHNKTPSYALFQSLTDKFESSLTSTLIRYKDFTEESIAIVMSINSIIAWASRSNSFKYFIESKTELPPNSCAIEYFKGNDLPTEFEEVERDIWFDASDIKHHLIVKELSIPLPYYNQVLSIIWLYENEDEIEYYEDEFDGYLKLKEKW